MQKVNIQKKESEQKTINAIPVVDKGGGDNNKSKRTKDSDGFSTGPHSGMPTDWLESQAVAAAGGLPSGLGLAHMTHQD
ncbi:hypothetical protein DPV78_000203 [Talaromyces pinophilus]|nr:hypothetical protein DPV78_000203 [Talaromyces pinophilus]